MFLQQRFMARAGITRAKLQILRGNNKQIYRGFSKFAEAVEEAEGGDQQGERLRGSVRGDNNNNNKAMNSKESFANWVPHPRSGIYVPQGHERVMDDVPNTAACFGHRTFWLRSVDGVEKPDPDYDFTF